MPSKQLIELVNRLKKSGIKIGFTAPRSKISLNSQDKNQLDNHCADSKPSCDSKKKRNPTLNFI